MNANHLKIRPLFKRQLTISSDSTRFLKKGEQHSRMVNTLVFGKCTNNFMRKVCKATKSKSNLKKIMPMREEAFLSEPNFLRYMNLKHVVYLRLVIFVEKLPFLERFRQLTNLRFLHIDISALTWNMRALRGEQAVHDFLKNALREMRNLKHYIIGLIHCDEISEKMLLLLLDTFYVLNPNTVEGVQLQFIVDYDFVLKSALNSFLVLLASHFTCFSKLKKLHWDLGSPIYEKSITVQPWNHIFNINSLQHFHLSGVELDKALFDGLVLLPYLKSLSLRIPMVSKNEILALAEGLNRLQPLQEIKLGLSKFRGQFEIGDEDFSKLCTSLERHSICLEILDLSILEDIDLKEKLSSLSSKGFSSMTYLLKSCSQLKHLHLFCPVELDKETWIRLMTSISNLSHLKSLFLFFMGNKNITDEVFSIFARTLLYLNLEELYIFFMSFCEVTDSGVSELAKTLAHMKKLQIFNMDLQHFPKLTKKASEDVSVALKKIKYLEQGRLRITQDKPQGYSLSLDDQLKDGTNEIKDIVGEPQKSEFMKYMFDIVYEKCLDISS